MRNLEQALSDHDLIVLRVIGEWLGLELTGTDKSAAIKTLTETLSNVDLRQEMEYMEPEEVAALTALAAQGGRAPVAAFSRDHGEVRQMGPGKMEREEPWLDPVSAAESLWYRGFLYRGFDDTAEGHLEFYYLPTELLAQLPAPETRRVQETAPALLQPVDPPADFRAAETDAVDDLTTMLALAQRTGLQPEKLGDPDVWLLNPDRDRRSLLLTLATETGLMKRGENGLRPTRAALEWLQGSREAQLRVLVDAWSRSAWNELRHTPGLICEGEGWQNDPLLARTALLDAAPRSTAWFRLSDLTAMIKQTDPDFHRPDGNYDTWYIRDAASGQYLSGFAGWDRVEGRLLRYLLQGPLFWLGMVETAGDGAEGLYRLTPRALDWLADRPPEADELRVPLLVQADATVLVPHNAGRHERFQAARIAEPEPAGPGKPYVYRLTPASLAHAVEQGITVERVLAFLEQSGGRPLPPSVQRAIRRWAERGVEGRLQRVVVLRVGDAAILETLRANPKTRDYIQESLGELAAVIRRDDWDAFRRATAQLGLLLDAEDL